MLNVTRLLCGKPTRGDHLRYTGARVHHRPVVVWNITRRCNLHCAHCYANAADRSFPGELTTAEARTVIDDLATYGVPVLLFSGGEPLLRNDLPDLVRHASTLGITPVLSTNGTLLTAALARQLADAGLSYAGVSLDGLEGAHDKFRGSKGAFRASVAALDHARAAGLRVGVRFTLTRLNYDQLEAILRLAEEKGADRCCVYHLAYAGRGERIADRDLTPQETRQAVDLIFQHALTDARPGLEFLTVDNHADAVYLYLRVRREQPERAAEVLELLQRNGGNSAGSGIGAIDNLGNVHPDQFWWHYSLGSVRERPFSRIWEDTSDPLLQGLRHRRGLINGRCQVCPYYDICNGNLRVRAESTYGDVWAEDPACYLTDAELGIPSKSAAPVGGT
ncbi:MAG: radical SAM protein [Chloroflexi bacterium]|nr:radical SAM protein [Chloroflexota bacterium]